MVFPTLDFEKELWGKGYKFVCGLDEVGRGSFAGPVAVGAVIFPKGFPMIDGLADSKLLKPTSRAKLATTIKSNAISWAVAEIGISKINRFGIGKATQMAFRKALRLLPKQAEYVLVDAFYIKHLNRKKQQAVKKGDSICASIAAASIIAKVHRDHLMKKLHKKYPKYGLAKNKGYGTKFHQEAIREYGLTRIHRRSFNLARFTCEVEVTYG